jgi:hypothetical protein
VTVSLSLARAAWKFYIFMLTSRMSFSLEANLLLSFPSASRIFCQYELLLRLLLSMNAITVSFTFYSSDWMKAYSFLCSYLEVTCSDSSRRRVAMAYQCCLSRSLRSWWMVLVMYACVCGAYFCLFIRAYISAPCSSSLSSFAFSLLLSLAMVCCRSSSSLIKNWILG